MPIFLPFLFCLLRFACPMASATYWQSNEYRHSDKSDLPQFNPIPISQSLWYDEFESVIYSPVYLSTVIVTINQQNNSSALVFHKYLLIGKVCFIAIVRFSAHDNYPFSSLIIHFNSLRHSFLMIIKHNHPIARLDHLCCHLYCHIVAFGLPSFPHPKATPC